MAKSKRNVGKAKAKKTRRSSNKTSQRVSKPANPTFGAVSTINTAPVAIGNSLRGSQPIVLQTAGGVRVIGRDYGFTPIATGTVTGWAMVGGMPLTPCCMPSTALRNFAQMYNKFKFNACNFHYITSSSTSTTGDVLFQYNKNSESSSPNWTSSSFLPYVMSDPKTVLGPQWTNHTLLVEPTGPWCSTDYGLTAEPHLYAQGDVFLYSKTSSTESPGYAIFDYDVTFKDLSVNPRAGILPTIKAQWTPVSLATWGNYTVSSSILVGTLGTSFIGSTTITAPTPAIGDIYKVVLDVTNSTLTGITAATFADEQVNNSASVTLTIADGMTLYLVFHTTTACYLYSNLEQAFVSEGNSTALVAGATANYASVVINGFMKLIGSSNASFNQVQY